MAAVVIGGAAFVAAEEEELLEQHHPLDTADRSVQVIKEKILKKELKHKEVNKRKHKRGLLGSLTSCITCSYPPVDDVPANAAQSTDRTKPGSAGRREDAYVVSAADVRPTHESTITVQDNTPLPCPVSRRVTHNGVNGDSHDGVLGYTNSHVDIHEEGEDFQDAVSRRSTWDQQPGSPRTAGGVARRPTLTLNNSLPQPEPQSQLKVQKQPQEAKPSSLEEQVGTTNGSVAAAVRMFTARERVGTGSAGSSSEAGGLGAAPGAVGAQMLRPLGKVPEVALARSVAHSQSTPATASDPPPSEADMQEGGQGGPHMYVPNPQVRPATDSVQQEQQHMQGQVEQSMERRSASSHAQMQAQPIAVLSTQQQQPNLQQQQQQQHQQQKSQHALDAYDAVATIDTSGPTGAATGTAPKAADKASHLTATPAVGAAPATAATPPLTQSGSTGAAAGNSMLLAAESLKQQPVPAYSAKASLVPPQVPPGVHPHWVPLKPLDVPFLSPDTVYVPVPENTGLNGLWMKVPELSAKSPMPIDIFLKSSWIARKAHDAIQGIKISETPEFVEIKARLLLPMGFPGVYTEKYMKDNSPSTTLMRRDVRPGTTVSRIWYTAKREIIFECQSFSVFGHLDHVGYEVMTISEDGQTLTCRQYCTTGKGRSVTQLFTGRLTDGTKVDIGV